MKGSDDSYLYQEWEKPQLIAHILMLSDALHRLREEMQVMMIRKA